VKTPALVLAAVAAVLGSTLLAAPAAQPLPAETAEVCVNNVISPIRGEGEHPPVLGPRHVTPDLPEFDTSLGELTEARIVATVRTELQGQATNISGTTQPFTISAGGQAYAGRTGANGYIDLGNAKVMQPVADVASGATVTIFPGAFVTAQAKTYDAALWETLGDFDAYVVIDDENTNASLFDWGFVVDRVLFTTCVQYSYQPRVERVAGADRFETSADIALAAYPSGADTVYIATGTNYPDALAAGPAAAADDAPLLLVTPTAIPTSISAAIATLDPSHIVVVGGTPSVSTSVYSQLSGMTDTIERLAGSDRFATSRLLAERGFDSSDYVFIATGLNFPDALSAGPAASAYAAPVILVNGGAGSLDAATADLVSDLRAQMAVIVGGTPSVSSGIQSDLDDLIPDAIRLAGSDRYETSHLVNEYGFFDPAGYETAFFATGAGFPDALSGSAWAAATGSPLFVVQPTCVPASILQDVQDMRIAEVVLLGGTPSLSAAVASFTEC
jgi:putative cell wall-binding protein